MIQPENDFLLVLQDPLPERVGEIALPQQRFQRPVSGIVQAVPDSLQAKYVPGDRLIFGQYAGVEVLVEGVKLLLISQMEVLAVIPHDVEVEAV